MRAIVTGCNGFIGFNLCNHLKQLDWRVLGIDDLSAGLPENTVEGFEYVHDKIQDRDKMADILTRFRPNAIFHFAAIPRVAYSVENPFDTAEANILGTVSLLEGILRSGLIGQTRFILSSSSAVYGGADQLPTPEEYPCDPKSPYALQKYQDELWVKMFVELYGLDGLSLRYFNVFGPHAIFGGAYSTVMTAWLYHLYVDPDYQPYLEGDGTQSRDFCFVENVIQANVLAATRDRPFTGQPINVAQGKAHNLIQVKEMLEEISGRELVLEKRPPRVGDVDHTLADITRAQAELGYEPSTDFTNQLAKMAAWYRSDYPKT
ncbi:MAG: GDP-mannose 4,6-dehydratase [Candidatus Promineifilaceae bacterium]